MPRVRSFHSGAIVLAEIVKAKKHSVLLEVWNGLVDVTPVDTGKARASWFITPGFPATKELPDGIYSRPQEPDLSRYSKNFTRWLIANTAHYLKYLNDDGHSKQAPAKFVESTVLARIKQESGIGKAIRKITAGR